MYKRAFTLIELLVVIAVISLLSAVVLTTLESARDKARAVAMLQKLQQIEKAIHIDFLNHGSYYTVGTGGVGGEGQIPGNFNYVYLSTIQSSGYLPSYTGTSEHSFSNYEYPEWQAGLIYASDGSIMDIENCHSTGTLRSGAVLYGFFDTEKASIAEAMNSLVDGDNLYTDCGKVFHRQGYIIYVLSPDPDIFP